MNCNPNNEPTVLAQDIENLLTPGVVGQWEFALSEPDMAVELTYTKVCQGCKGEHVRLAFESLEEHENAPPERAWVIELKRDDEGDLVVFSRIYDDGVLVAGCMSLPASASSFLNDFTDTVAQSLKSLRTLTVRGRSVPEGTTVH